MLGQGIRCKVSFLDIIPVLFKSFFGVAGFSDVDVPTVRTPKDLHYAWELALFRTVFHMHELVFTFWNVHSLHII